MLEPEGGLLSHLFIGRHEEREQVKTRLLHRDHFLLLFGQPLIGKASLALQVAEELRNEHDCSDDPPLIVHTVDCKDASDWPTVVLAISRALRLDEVSSDENLLLSSIPHRLQTASGSRARMLLLLLRVHSLNPAGTDAQRMARCLAALGACGVMTLVTSRRQLVLPHVLRIKPMTPNDEVALLRHHAPDVTATDFESLVRRYCHGLPPLVMQMARLVSGDPQLALTPAELHQALEEDAGLLMQNLGLEEGKKIYEAISPDVKGHVSSLAELLDAGSFSLEILQAGVGLEDARFKILVRKLRDEAQFICDADDSRRMRIEPIVLNYVRQMGHVHADDQARLRVVTLLGRVLTQAERNLYVVGQDTVYGHLHGDWPLLQRVLRQAIHCTGNTYQAYLKVALRADNLLAKCFPNEALAFYHNMEAASRQYGTPHDRAVLLGLIGMAVTLGKGTGWQEALQYFHRALPVLETDRRSVTYLRLLCDVGRTYFRLHRLQESEKCLRKAMAISEETYVEDEKELVFHLLRARSILALPTMFRGHLCESKELLFETLELCEQYAPGHPEKPILLNSLGLVYERSDEDQDMAMHYYIQSLAERRRYSDVAPGDLVIPLNNVGMQYRRRGDYDSAFRLLEEAEQIRARDSRWHYYSGLTQNHLGRVSLEIGDYIRAERHLEEASTIYRRCTPRHDARTRLALCIAHLYITEPLRDLRRVRAHLREACALAKAGEEKDLGDSGLTVVLSAVQHLAQLTGFVSVPDEDKAWMRWAQKILSDFDGDRTQLMMSHESILSDVMGFVTSGAAAIPEDQREALTSRVMALCSTCQELSARADARGLWRSMEAEAQRLSSGIQALRGGPAIQRVLTLTEDQQQQQQQQQPGGAALRLLRQLPRQQRHQGPSTSRDDFPQQSRADQPTLCPQAAGQLARTSNTPPTPMTPYHHRLHPPCSFTDSDPPSPSVLEPDAELSLIDSARSVMGAVEMETPDGRQVTLYRRLITPLQETARDQVSNSGRESDAAQNASLLSPEYRVTGLLLQQREAGLPGPLIGQPRGQGPGAVGQKPASDLPLAVAEISGQATGSAGCFKRIHGRECGCTSCYPDVPSRGTGFMGRASTEASAGGGQRGLRYSGGGPARRAVENSEVPQKPDTPITSRLPTCSLSRAGGDVTAKPTTPFGQAGLGDAETRIQERLLSCTEVSWPEGSQSVAFSSSSSSVFLTSAVLSRVDGSSNSDFTSVFEPDPEDSNVDPGPRQTTTPLDARQTHVPGVCSCSSSTTTTTAAATMSRSPEVTSPLWPTLASPSGSQVASPRQHTLPLSSPETPSTPRWFPLASPPPVTSQTPPPLLTSSTSVTSQTLPAASPSEASEHAQGSSSAATSQTLPPPPSSATVTSRPPLTLQSIASCASKLVAVIPPGGDIVTLEQRRALEKLAALPSDVPPHVPPTPTTTTTTSTTAKGRSPSSAGSQEPEQEHLPGQCQSCSEGYHHLHQGGEGGDTTGQVGTVSSSKLLECVQQRRSTLALGDQMDRLHFFQNQQQQQLQCKQHRQLHQAGSGEGRPRSGSSPLLELRREQGQQPQPPHQQPRQQQQQQQHQHGPSADFPVRGPPSAEELLQQQQQQPDSSEGGESVGLSQNYLRYLSHHFHTIHQSQVKTVADLHPHRHPSTSTPKEEPVSSSSATRDQSVAWSKLTALDPQTSAATTPGSGNTTASSPDRPAAPEHHPSRWTTSDAHPSSRGGQTAERPVQRATRGAEEDVLRRTEQAGPVAGGTGFEPPRIAAHKVALAAPAAPARPQPTENDERQSFPGHVCTTADCLCSRHDFS